MDVGIGLPNSVRGVDRRGIVDWSRRAEAAGFSSLGTIDRLAYPSYESLTALTAAAAVTERIRLVTDILIAPLRTNTALLAKQAATIDHLSGGRLTLGLAVGGREDDFAIGGTDFAGRGRAFDEQLETLSRLWREDAVAPGAPGRERPGLLIGGSNPRSFKRAAAHRRADHRRRRDGRGHRARLPRRIRRRRRARAHLLPLLARPRAGGPACGRAALGRSPGTPRPPGPVFRSAPRGDADGTRLTGKRAYRTRAAKRRGGKAKR